MHSNRFRVNRLYLALRDEFGGFSCITVENEGSSHVATGMCPHGSQASFQVARENSGLLSSQYRGIQPHLILS